ncbi:unnamed protein product [Fraxinus pennsylvanica]|uniref:Terpene synthase metal-binding domain-containing protein n=1 Tax=Fraxinus pennsylvanica TaxID=56036 RepID=A0AAD2DMM8_9LAMI|nr:unnamed protein product [Fraxinus pennsylvanica]
MQTKVIAMLSVIDDIYDIYGTLDELTLLMDAIEREIIPCSLRDRGEEKSGKGMFSRGKMGVAIFRPKVGKPSSTCILSSLVSLTDIGELVSKDAFEWVASEPLILQVQFEQKTSAVGCYMNQNNGASEEEAFAEIQNQVTNAWKVINQECLRPAVPMAFLGRVIVNLARVSHTRHR